MVIGDVYIDFEMVEVGIVYQFFVFMENVLCENILDKVDYIMFFFDEFLYVNQMFCVLFYLKNCIQVLLMEGVYEDVVVVFEGEGYDVKFLKDLIMEKELLKKFKKVFILGVLFKILIIKSFLENVS